MKQRICLPPVSGERCEALLSFPQPENMEDLRGVRDAIQQRVEDMIGGMRMMNRFV